MSVAAVGPLRARLDVGSARLFTSVNYEYSYHCARLCSESGSVVYTYHGQIILIFSL